MCFYEELTYSESTQQKPEHTKLNKRKVRLNEACQAPDWTQILQNDNSIEYALLSLAMVSMYTITFCMEVKNLKLLKMRQLRKPSKCVHRTDARPSQKNFSTALLCYSIHFTVISFLSPTHNEDTVSLLSVSTLPIDFYLQSEAFHAGSFAKCQMSTPLENCPPCANPKQHRDLCLKSSLKSVPPTWYSISYWVCCHITSLNIH